MIDREKVIKAIEYCTGDSVVCYGDKCPYWKDGVSNIVCWNNVMKDAGELLKTDQYYLQKMTERLQIIADNANYYGEAVSRKYLTKLIDRLRDIAIRGLPEVKDD